MKTKTLIGVILLSVGTVTNSAFADGDSSKAGAGYTVTLQYAREATLTQPQASMIYSNVVELLKSANFNSSEPHPGAWPAFEVPGVQKDYRWTAAHKYLVVSFKEGQTIKTIGGVVDVREIIVGLDNGRGRNELFTVDEAGRVISYAKYSGPIWVELTKAAEKIAGKDA